jgi:hypothetical protein
MWSTDLDSNILIACYCPGSLKQPRNMVERTGPSVGTLAGFALGLMSEWTFVTRNRLVSGAIDPVRMASRRRSIETDGWRGGTPSEKRPQDAGATGGEVTSSTTGGELVHFRSPLGLLRQERPPC